jgi:serine/threonine-protein kinase
VITLTLLHPIQSIPVQSWSFEHESVVRIGRSTDNHVILYSAVVSRHHVELRRTESHWEIVNLGANGTYLDGKRITQVPIQDGVMIRLARSGPNIQIHLGKATQNFAGETTLSQRNRQQTMAATSDQQKTGEPAKSGDSLDSPSPPTNLPKTDFDPQPPGALFSKSVGSTGNGNSAVRGEIICSHPRAKPGMVFCIDCGEPLQILQTIGEYQVVKVLRQDETAVTYLGCRHDQRLLLKTLSPECISQEAIAQFQQQAMRLLQFNHPGLPRFVDFFLKAGHPYLVMEPVHGKDLQQRVLSQGAFAHSEAIAILLQLCDVLDYLHQQSPPFLHLDLTPANLIQQLPPIPVRITVAGFLSLPLLQPVSSHSTSYIAPEQIQGQPVPASDLFALGPILVYLLTGKDPGSFYAQREQGFRLYPEYIPGLHSDLATVIRRLTNPDATERYDSAQDVAEALLQVSQLLVL